MEALYGLIKSIAAYLILVTVLFNLVNGSTYKKYVELVCGMVLILIVIKPLTSFLSLEEDFLYQFNLSSFEIEMREEGVFKEAEEIKQKKMEKEYKKLLNARVSSIVEQEGRQVENTEIVLAEEDYGTIEKIMVEISELEGETDAHQEKEGNKVEIALIEPVQISLGEENTLQEPIMEKNKITEEIRKKIASEFAMQEGRIIVYQEDR